MNSTEQIIERLKFVKILLRIRSHSSEIHANHIKTIDDAIDLLKEIKQGKWIILDDCSNAGIYCSECYNKIFDYTHKPKKKLSNYCPNCGSKNDLFYNPTTKRYMNGT